MLSGQGHTYSAFEAPQPLHHCERPLLSRHCAATDLPIVAIRDHHHCVLQGGSRLFLYHARRILYGLQLQGRWQLHVRPQLRDHTMSMPAESSYLVERFLLLSQSSVLSLTGANQIMLKPCLLMTLGRALLR